MQNTMWKEKSEGSIGLAFVSTTFWKRQNYEVIGGFWERRGRRTSR